jgi:hypothetical protein
MGIKTHGDGSVKEGEVELHPLFVFATARRASHRGPLLALIVGLTAAACTIQKSAAPPNDIRLPEGVKTATSVAYKPDAVRASRSNGVIYNEPSI